MCNSFADTRLTCLPPHSSTEQKFMEASRSFEKGKPIITDEQYDELKKQLRRDRSAVVAQVCFVLTVVSYQLLLCTTRRQAGQIL